MKPDQKMLLEQCDTTFKEYLRALNCCKQCGVNYRPEVDVKENKDLVFASSRLESHA